jgi:hypothetical protein
MYVWSNSVGGYKNWGGKDGMSLCLNMMVGLREMRPPLVAMYGLENMVCDHNRRCSEEG